MVNRLLTLWLASLCLHAAASTPVLDFDTALSQILERSLDLSRERTTLDQIEATNLTARTAFLPSLELAGSQSKSGTQGDSSSSFRKVEAVSSLNLFSFGADWARLSSARSQEDAQQARIRSEILRSEGEAVRAIATYTQRSLETSVNAKILETRAKFLEIARARYEQGLLPAQEVERVKIDLKNLEANQSDQRSQLNSAAANLTKLLGHTSVATKWPWTERLPQIAQLKTSSLMAGEPDLSSRPDWTAARKDVEAATDSAVEGARRVLPSLDASFRYGWYDLTQTPYRQWSGALTLSIPLFDRLSNYSTWRSRVHARTIAEIEAERIDRSARAEVQARRQDFELAIKTALNREETLAISRRLYDDAFKRFKAGRLDANNLSIEQNRLSDSEILAISGWSQAHIAFSDLCHALGRRVSECLK